MNTIKDIEIFLHRLHARIHGHVQKDMTLERMWPLLDAVGNPQDSLSVIHVAGTSGKTSTCYFIAEILATGAGLKVGLTVSPHISSVTERLQVGNTPVSDAEFVELFNAFIQSFDETKLDATYFELMIVFVLWAFVQLGVDVAVLETGLGGLFDGTNVCRRSDKVCVITEIGYDHQDILGETLEEIARQKAGIIHEGNEVFLYEKEPLIQRVFDERINKVGAHKHIIENPKLDESDPLTLYQQRNWQLAWIVASKYAEQTQRTKLVRNDIYQMTSKQVPGRMQKLSVANSEFYLDGAHNVQKAQALVESMKTILGDRKIPVILAVKKGKDSEGFLRIIKDIASYVICTEYHSRQDVPVSSISAHELAEQARQIGLQSEISSSIELAVTLLEKRNEPVVLVTGSLYGLGQATRAVLSRMSF